MDKTAKAVSATNADTATYATNAGTASGATYAARDGAGQQINTTYIKNATVSGKVVTFTKGNGGTFSITTQDNNTTYANMGNATTATNGTAGLVPAPTKNQYSYFLTGHGWDNNVGNVYIDSDLYTKAFPNTSYPLIHTYNEEGTAYFATIGNDDLDELLLLDASGGYTLQELGSVNNKVSKSGDTMTGNLTVPSIELKKSGVTTPYIDFHYNNSSSDYTSRIIEESSGVINLIASNGVKINGTKIDPSSSAAVEQITYDFDNNFTGTIFAYKMGNFLFVSIDVYRSVATTTWQEITIAEAMDISPYNEFPFAAVAQDSTGTAFNIKFGNAGSIILCTRATALPADTWIRGSGWAYCRY